MYRRAQLPRRPPPPPRPIAHIRKSGSRPVPPVKDPQAGTGSIPTFFTTNYTLCSKQSKFTLIQVTVEPRYNEVLGTTKTTLPHQVQKTKKHKEVGPAEPPGHNRVPPYPTSLQRGPTVPTNYTFPCSCNKVPCSSTINLSFFCA